MVFLACLADTIISHAVALGFLMFLANLMILTNGKFPFLPNWILEPYQISSMPLEVIQAKPCMK